MRIRTGYSFRKAVGKLDAVASRLLECGYPAFPITDTASTFGFNRWSKLCKAKGAKPIFGVELAVSPSPNAKKPITDHWTFIAKDDLSAIHHLVSTASRQFRYQPLLNYEQAIKAQGVFKIAGHKADLDRLPIDDPNFFVGLSPSVSFGYWRGAKEQGHKFMPCSDNRYPAEGEQGFYEVICGRDASTQSYPQHILTHEELMASLPFVPDVGWNAAWDNWSLVATGANAELKQGTLLHPPPGKTLRQLCLAGADKLKVDIATEPYTSRLNHELKLIADKDFEDYFFIIADMCQWARERMIVGPARGSSSGSLVCYLLQITTIDPIKYELIFERFIDVNRDDLPDIDIDFSDQHRQMVFDYMADKYGPDHVARLGTVAMYKSRSALGEAAAALDIPPWEINPVLDSMIERSGGDSRALDTILDTLTETTAGQKLLKTRPEIIVASAMEGHPRHHSQHAAGIVLTEKPVTEYVAIDERTGATHCDKKDAEDLGLLKIDALGLTQLSIFEDALEAAGLPHNHLDTIPLDDSATFDVLNDGHFAGIFQFNGLALQSITQQVECKDLEDIVSITALARPGPLNTGGTNRWIKVKTGAEPVTYPHPLFEPHLEKTLGIVAYQEQVMNIGREIGDLSWGDVTDLRKAMSKSLGREYFDKYGDRWKKAAIKKGVPPEVAESVWDDLCAYGSWAFNRSHAVAYGLVSYYCCWLKAHYPIEFAAATLTHMRDPGQQIKMLREMHEEGTDYVPVIPEQSTNKWSVGSMKGEKVLIGPLSNVKGVGPKIEHAILAARARGEPMPERAQKIMQDPVTEISDLWPISSAIKRCMPDPAEKNIFTPPRKLEDCQTNGSEQEVLVFVRLAQIKPKNENEAINVAKRGYEVKGPSASLNLRIEDDTDAMFAKIDRWKYDTIGKQIVDHGRAGKALYAIKGTIPDNFRMIRIKMIRHIGDMEQ